MIYVFGDGQGEGPVEDGTIGVKYPAGATCTVTNGSQTYTALDTSGAAAFIVEPGTWTVKAVQGSESNSKSVTVTAGGWVEVELSFGLWLYKNGNTYDSVTGGWMSFVESNNTVNFNSDNIYIRGTYVKNSHGSTAYAYPKNKIDLSKYTSLRAKLSDVSYSSTNQCGIMVNDSLTNVTSGTISQHHKLADFIAAAAASDGEVSIDISALEGEYYVLSGVTYGSAAGTSSLTCTEMWLAN